MERKKRKKIILEEFDTIDPLLTFVTKAGNVREEHWRKWKKENFFTATTWDFLLNAVPHQYFVKRLTNKAKNKRAHQYKDRLLLKVLPLLKNFLKMKKGCHK